jgi:hypothetical protein
VTRLRSETFAGRYRRIHAQLAAEDAAINSQGGVPVPAAVYDAPAVGDKAGNLSESEPWWLK